MNPFNNTTHNPFPHTTHNPFPSNTYNPFSNNSSVSKHNSSSFTSNITSPTQTKKFTLIYISGLSGSGKTTLGRRLKELIDNALLIDQDSYFSRKKSIVTLSSGEPVVNFDSEDSIRWDDFNDSIEMNLKSQNVIVTGYQLRKHKMRLTPDFHFLLIRDILVDGKHNIETLTKFCYEDRQQSKRFAGKESEKFIVPELVIPFYFQTLQCLPDNTITINTMVYNGHSYERMNINTIISYILKKLPDTLY
jgi:gluconate kinase